MGRWLAPGLALVAITMSASPALGLLLWTLAATPLTMSSGVATEMSFTATNLDALTELGCLEVDPPSSFTIVGASAGNASNGDQWEAVVFPNKVAVHSLSGGGRLGLGHSITFTITIVPTEPGTWAWPNHAHGPEDCTGIDENGAPLTVVVVASATPTPIPSIGPLPTLPPTEPLPSVSPTPPGLLPTPPATPGAVPTPPAASPTATTGAAPSPAATPTESVAVTPPGGSSGAPPPTVPNSSGAEPVQLVLGEPEGSGGGVGEVSLGPLGVIDGITVWAIPGAIVGGPGLLVILWVLAQTGFALAWIPAVRRMRGRDSADSGPFSGPRRTVAS